MTGHYRIFATCSLVARNGDMSVFDPDFVARMCDQMLIKSDGESRSQCFRRFAEGQRRGGTSNWGISIAKRSHTAIVTPICARASAWRGRTFPLQRT
jgi:hypothetical protein